MEISNKNTKDSYRIKNGTGKIMFSAPHNVSQTREGIVKCAEPQTGVLVKELHKILNCPIIYKTANCGDDANYDKKSDYKEALKRYVIENNIEIVIDIHQLSPTKDIMVDIGTGKWKNLNDINLLNMFLYAFSEQNIGVIQIDKPFAGAAEYTVSLYIAEKCKILTVQIELNSRLLCEEFLEYAFDKVLTALQKCFLKITQYNIDNKNHYVNNGSC